MCPWDGAHPSPPPRGDLFPGSREGRGKWASNAVGTGAPKWIQTPECLPSAVSCLGEGGEEDGYLTRRAQAGSSDHLGRGRAWNPCSVLELVNRRPGVGGGGFWSCGQMGAGPAQAPGRRKLCLFQKPMNTEPARKARWTRLV